jgi:glucose/arabinose dehydrogenase
MLFKRYLLSIILVLSFISNAFASSEIFDSKVIANGLVVPWGMTFINGNELLVTQRQGTVVKLNIETNELTNISGLPKDIRVEGQGGLFDIQLAPQNQNNDWLYLSYNKNVDGQGTTTLARAKLNGSQFTDWQDLLITQSRTSKKVHYGGRISFDDQGHVFLSIGDRGVRSSAQNTQNHAGSIIRLNIDGSVPNDNPFVNNTQVLDEIWSYGHRNPQGLFFNVNNQQLWSAEHGPRGGDEVNLIEAGKNYGWPVISYGKEYWGPIAVGKGTEREGMEQPVEVYIPSIATSSLIQYSGKLFKSLENNLLIGALNLQHLNVLELDKHQAVKQEQRLFKELNRRIRNVIEGPKGNIYLATDSGEIIKLSPALH